MLIDDDAMTHRGIKCTLCTTNDDDFRQEHFATMMMLQITKLISFILADTTDKRPQITGFRRSILSYSTLVDFFTRAIAFFSLHTKAIAL